MPREDRANYDKGDFVDREARSVSGDRVADQAQNLALKSR